MLYDRSCNSTECWTKVTSLWHETKPSVTVDSLELTFCAVTWMVILRPVCNIVRILTMFALYFLAYINSYDKSPFNSSPFNSTMKNTCALFCVEIFTSWDTFHNAESYTAFITYKNSSHIKISNEYRSLALQLWPLPTLLPFRDSRLTPV